MKTQFKDLEINSSFSWRSKKLIKTSHLMGKIISTKQELMFLGREIVEKIEDDEDEKESINKFYIGHGMP